MQQVRLFDFEFLVFQKGWPAGLSDHVWNVWFSIRIQSNLVSTDYAKHLLKFYLPFVKTLGFFCQCLVTFITNIAICVYINECFKKSVLQMRNCTNKLLEKIKSYCKKLQTSPSDWPFFCKIVQVLQSFLESISCSFWWRKQVLTVQKLAFVKLLGTCEKCKIKYTKCTNNCTRYLQKQWHVLVCKIKAKLQCFFYENVIKYLCENVVVLHHLARRI